MNFPSIGLAKLAKLCCFNYSETAYTFGTFPSVFLIEGVRLTEIVKVVQFLLTIDIQQLLCTVMLHVVKEAVQSSSSLPFITNFKLFVNANKITYFSTYFKDVIQMLLLSFQSGVCLIEVFNNRN